jgi:hypothetical protein
MNLYLGGKMVGIPGLGFVDFDKAEAKLRYLGHNVFNPAAYDRKAGYIPAVDDCGTYFDTPEFNRSRALLDDVTWILTESEGMVAMANWVDSPGTRLEVAAHQAIFLPVWELDDFLRYGVSAPILDTLKPGHRPMVKSSVMTAAR